ncbi:lysozyme [Phenylobacterium immobile]|uniref:lysozyme n=1 Tax=Phenylobacterium immobile TaxID=21 RepID=UPI000A8850AB|nr:lysozyme [Phenylobacterium immobile]
MRSIPANAATFVAAHEGLRLEAYRDPAGVWTIGYGHTEDVAADRRITRLEAEALLAQDLAVAASRLAARIGPVVGELTEGQYAALLSFVFNVGADPGWTIWKRLRARQFDQVPLELMRFVNAGGRKLNGLVARRAEECKLWAREEPGSSAEAVSSGVTRAQATPPTAADPTPPQKSATVLTGAISAAAAAPVAAKAVTEAMAPYGAASPWVAQALAVVATVAALAATMVVVLTWLKAREARS